MIRGKEMLIQYTVTPFKEIAKEKKIEYEKVADYDYNGILEHFSHALVYKYKAKTDNDKYCVKAGDLVTVIETGTGSCDGSYVICIIMIPGELNKDEVFKIVKREERKYINDSIHSFREYKKRLGYKENDIFD